MIVFLLYRHTYHPNASMDSATEQQHLLGVYTTAKAAGRAAQADYAQGWKSPTSGPLTLGVPILIWPKDWEDREYAWIETKKREGYTIEKHEVEDMSEKSYEERSCEFWKVAGTFSAEKEKVYPEHAIAHEFDKHTGKVVLEYGCGGGSDTISWLRRQNSVIYVDVVPENLETTKRRIVENARELFQHPGVWARPKLTLAGPPYPLLLPADFEDDVGLVSRVDVISSHGVLHHIVDPTPVLREFHRILKPGGMLYVMLYTENLWKQHETRIKDFVANHGLSAEEAFGWCTDGEGCPYARAYTSEEGCALLESCGFQIESTMLYHQGLFRTFRAVKP